MAGYRDLEVWKKARVLVANIYTITGKFPEAEKYGLISQLRRAAVSVVANIAEGNSRFSTNEYAHFVSIARGSAGEVEALLLVAVDLGYSKEENMVDIFKQLDEISRMLNKLWQVLKQKS